MIWAKGPLMMQVLVYVFEQCMHSHSGVDVDLIALQDDLQHAGFPQNEVDDALVWLKEYANELNADILRPSLLGARLFSAKEYQQLGQQAISTLMQLFDQGILNERTREIVISRLMALGEAPILAKHVRCVVLLVLFSFPEGEDALSKMDYWIRVEKHPLLVRH